MRSRHDTTADAPEARLGVGGSVGVAAGPSPRNGRLADLLLVLLVAYSANVLNPVLSAQNFADIELGAHIAATAEANRVNQLFWMGATGLALIVAMRSWRNRLGPMIAANSCLAALAVMALLSPLWALAPEISARRAVQQSMVVICVFAAVAGSRSVEHCLRVVYLALGICLTGQFAALVLPNAFDWRGDFRGVYGDKNGLGALAVIALLVGGAVRPNLVSGRARLTNLGYLAAWLSVLALSHSKTSLGLLLLVPCLVLLLHLLARATRLSIGLHLAVASLVMVAVLFFLVAGAGIAPRRLLAVVSPDDATLTGRTAIWQFAIQALGERWGFGYGYQSFWNVGLASPNLHAEDAFIRYLNQAHNGYLDVLLALGAVGLFLVLGAIGQGFAATSRVRSASPIAYRVGWALILFALLHNLIESSLLRGYAPPWLFLLLALALAARSLREASIAAT